MDRATSTASYTVSAGTAAGGMLSLNEWALLLGIAFAGLTFLINWWYQKRRRVDELLHQEHLRQIEAERVAKEMEFKAAHNEREREFHAARMSEFIKRGPLGE